MTAFALPRDPVAGPDPAGRAAATDTGLNTFTVPSWVTKLIERVRSHLAGSPQDFAGTPLDWSRVSEFQRAVYVRAQSIKPGCTRSYGEIARELGLGPAGARAVGVALSTNPWPLLVPCHRVVSADGKMTGFSAPGGVRTKTRLLALEGAQLFAE